MLQYCSVLYNMKYLIVMHWFSDAAAFQPRRAEAYADHCLPRPLPFPLQAEPACIVSNGLSANPAVMEQPTQSHRLKATAAAPLAPTMWRLHWFENPGSV